MRSLSQTEHERTRFLCWALAKSKLGHNGSPTTAAPHLTDNSCRAFSKLLLSPMTSSISAESFASFSGPSINYVTRDKLGGEGVCKCRSKNEPVTCDGIYERPLMREHVRGNESFRCAQHEKSKLLQIYPTSAAISRRSKPLFEVA